MPIGSDLQPFFSTVKSAPGDWHQVISNVVAREDSQLAPIECQVRYFVSSLFAGFLLTTISAFHPCRTDLWAF